MPPLEERKQVLAAHAGRRLLIGHPPRRSPDHELGVLTHRLRNATFAAVAVAIGDVKQSRLRLRTDSRGHSNSDIFYQPALASVFALDRLNFSIITIILIGQGSSLVVGGVINFLSLPTLPNKSQA